MDKKPTYEELEQRVKELGNEAVERKRAEEALRETTDYLYSLFNYANAPIIVWDLDARITRFNHAFEHLTGYTSDEVIGQELQILFTEPSRDESLNKIAETLSGEYWESVEIPILRKDGDIRIALWNSANIYAEDGKTIVATIAQGQDITERRKMEQQLMLADRLSSLGRLSRGIAHEIRNPLAGINLFVDILHDKEKFAQTDRETEILNEIRDNVNRMAGMIKRLVNFANPSAKTKENIDINALIREGINLWSAKFIEAEINSELSLGDDILLVSGDSIELQQAIDNLVKNALEVMEKGGILGISTTEGMSSFHKNRQVVIIKIKDTGPGIKPEDKGSIFNPFFTTKHTSAGLGLAISHQIIARHGGTISCESEPGEGTTFTIELPCVSAKNSGASPQSE